MIRGAIRRWWSIALGAALLIAVVAELKAQPASDDALVLAADNKLGQALRSADKSAARRLLSLEFSFVDASGKLHSRKDFLANLKAVAAASQSDAKVSTYGRIAMVTGHRKTASNTDVFFLDIWALQKRAWRALVMQNVVLAAAGAPVAGAAAGGAAAKPRVCTNPCQTIPYRVRSPTEQDIVNSFQALEKASVAHNAEEWSKHVADEFVLYRTGANPIPKSRRIATIKRQQDSNAVVTVGEVQDMQLTAYNTGAAMIATHAMPDKSRPAYRAARVWVKRNGQWQMAISVQTDIK